MFLQMTNVRGEQKGRKNSSDQVDNPFFLKPTVPSGPCVLFGEFFLTVVVLFARTTTKGVLEFPWECFLRPAPLLDLTKVLLLLAR